MDPAVVIDGGDEKRRKEELQAEERLDVLA